MGRRLKIAIIGAGFSGTVLAAALNRLNVYQKPLDIFLCEKTGCFGPGEAYRTRQPYHLLNVKAKDMSAFPDDPDHFVSWLKNHSSIAASADSLLIREQFVSRFLYGDYLQFLLQQIHHNIHIKLKLISSEVVDIIEIEKQQTAQLIFKEGNQLIVDKVVLAIGNHLPPPLPFHLPDSIHYIANPWQPNLFNQIPATHNVLIIGTGLSMADAVLSLSHQQHQGKIYATSRRGLLPLPHADQTELHTINKIPHRLRELTQFLRLNTGNNWQSMINSIRQHVPTIWNKMSLFDKKQFLRHVLPYWNIHRHRLPQQTLQFLKVLSDKQQFILLPGRIKNINQETIQLKLRATGEIKNLSIHTIINCMGPTLAIKNGHSLVDSMLKNGIALLDELQIGFRMTQEGALLNADHKPSHLFYALGSPTKGLFWESNAVPEIRQYCFTLAKKILD